MAQPFLSVFSMELMKKFFSEDWHLWEDAIKEIQKHVKLGTKSDLLGSLEQEKVFTAVVGICSHGVGDKISQVIHASIELLLLTVDMVYPTVTKNVRSELNAYVDTLMLWLLDKLGDNNSRIWEQSKWALETMITHPAIGILTLVEKLTLGEIKATTATSHWHILGRN